MRCKICNLITENIFEARILNKYNIRYFYCNSCGFLQTEEPFWLNEAYNEVINIYDTGILSRNLELSKTSSVIIYYLYNRKRKFLDYAGGYGIFTRLMRDVGFDFYWHDPYCKNLIARGFEYNHNDKIDLLTSFESFEHFVNPIEEIEKMLSISKNILFTTGILPVAIPQPQDWWYYGMEHGQHVSFYSQKTLEFIANKYKLNFYSFRSIHLLTEKQINPAVFKFIKYLHKLKLYNQIEKFLLDKINSKMRNRMFNDMQFLIRKTKENSYESTL
ncbi:MAG: Glycosyl transferase, family 2 [uncultured bacterium]|nr:MAG: Glycosyl transferase, family 2 [uncultured bacterium]